MVDPISALKHIHIVLVHPQQPGNIGSVCRIMQNMGISHLRLVNPPKGFADDEQAISFAMFAKDRLTQCEIFTSLRDALSDISVPIALSRRNRSILPCEGFIDEWADEWVSMDAANSLALVFGREDRGLTNEELSLCQRMVQIKTIDPTGSLSLPSAVLLTCYECLKRVHASKKNSDDLWITSTEIEATLNSIHPLLESLHFYGKNDEDRTQRYLRSILGKARLTSLEAHWIQNFFYHIHKKWNES